MGLFRNREMSPLPRSPQEAAKSDNDQIYNLWQNNMINVQPLESSYQPFELSPREIYERMETDHCVKKLPTIHQQLNDEKTDRSNPVTMAIHGEALLPIETIFYSVTKEKTSERELLQLLANDFETLYRRVVERKGEYSSTASWMRDIKDNFNFVGRTELLEAAAGIATYWKERMDRYPENSIFVLLGEISKLGAVYGPPPGKVKSDEFLMDLIIQNFTDEELVKYRDRLLIDESALTGKSPENIDVVLLDDWTMTGTEMTHQLRSFLKRRPELASRTELQLVIADEERIKIGFRPGNSQDDTIWLPTRGYFMANKGKSAWDISVSGSHSSDHTTADNLAIILKEIGDSEGVLPRGLQVARPYHDDGYATTFRQRMEWARHSF